MWVSGVSPPGRRGGDRRPAVELTARCRSTTGPARFVPGKRSREPRRRRPRLSSGCCRWPMPGCGCVAADLPVLLAAHRDAVTEQVAAALESLDALGDPAAALAEVAAVKAEVAEQVSRAEAEAQIAGPRGRRGRRQQPRPLQRAKRRPSLNGTPRSRPRDSPPKRWRNWSRTSRYCARRSGSPASNATKPCTTRRNCARTWQRRRARRGGRAGGRGRRRTGRCHHRQGRAAPRRRTCPDAGTVGQGRGTEEVLTVLRRRWCRRGPVAPR